PEQAVEQGTGAEAVQRDDQHHRREQGEEQDLPGGGTGGRVPGPAEPAGPRLHLGGVQRALVAERDLGRPQFAQLLAGRQHGAGGVAYVLAAETALQPAAALVVLGGGGHASHAVSYAVRSSWTGSVAQRGPDRPAIAGGGPL